jgi:hypothetical protein
MSARPPLRWTVGHERFSLRIEVADQGGRWLERAKPAGQRHLGLTIVREVASAWGIEGDGSGHRTVWFELRPVSAPLSSGVSLNGTHHEIVRWREVGSPCDRESVAN